MPIPHLSWAGLRPSGWKEGCVGPSCSTDSGGELYLGGLVPALPRGARRPLCPAGAP